MKKFFKSLALVLSFGLVLVFLASCSNVSQSYADKVNNAAKDNKALTCETVLNDLGDEAFNLTTSSLSMSTATGVIVAVKGFNKNMSDEEVQKKLDAADENTKYEVITITVALGKATGAAYASMTGAQVKAALASK